MKRLFFVLSAILVLLAFSACEQKESTAEPQTTRAEPTVSAEPTASAEPKAEASALRTVGG